MQDLINCLPNSAFFRLQTEPLNGCMITQILSNRSNRYDSLYIHYLAPHISFYAPPFTLLAYQAASKNDKKHVKRLDSRNRGAGPILTFLNISPRRQTAGFYTKNHISLQNFKNCLKIFTLSAAVSLYVSFFILKDVFFAQVSLLSFSQFGD